MTRQRELRLPYATIQRMGSQPGREEVVHLSRGLAGQPSRVVIAVDKGYQDSSVGDFKPPYPTAPTSTSKPLEAVTLTLAEAQIGNYVDGQIVSFMGLGGHEKRRQIRVV